MLRKKPLLSVGNNTELSIKRLRVKSTKQEVIEKKDTTERAPISKIIIVKKDKIRKFMKNKKKEIISQAKTEK